MAFCAFCDNEIKNNDFYRDEVEKRLVFCSRECVIKYYEKRFWDMKDAGLITDRGYDKPMRACEQCGAMFEVEAPQQKYCSTKCSAKARRIRMKGAAECTNEKQKMCMLLK